MTLLRVQCPEQTCVHSGQHTHRAHTATDICGICTHTWPKAGVCSPRTFPQDQVKGLGARSLFRNWLGSLDREFEPGKDGNMVNGPKGAPDTRPRKTLGGPPGCHGCQGLWPGLIPSTESCHKPVHSAHSCVCRQLRRYKGRRAEPTN